MGPPICGYFPEPSPKTCQITSNVFFTSALCIIERELFRTRISSKEHKRGRHLIYVVFDFVSSKNNVAWNPQIALKTRNRWALDRSWVSGAGGILGIGIGVSIAVGIGSVKDIGMSILMLLWRALRSNSHQNPNHNKNKKPHFLCHFRNQHLCQTPNLFVVVGFLNRFCSPFPIGTQLEPCHLD